MNNKFLERARQIISEPKILSIIAAKRARQLALGARPMVKCKEENHLDIALFEIAEGKIGYEFIEPEELEKELAIDQEEQGLVEQQP